MIHISNLRKESQDGWTKLIADITQLGGGQNYLPEPVIWIAVKDEDAYMLADDVYDAFVLVPLYIGMYYKEDVHIHGCVSKKLYKNVMNYLQRILCDFSDNLSRINIKVDGFKIADGEPDVIGAGLSCGVDSLSTVYDRYVKEDDPDYRINALFFFNTGWHGDYYHEGTMKLCMDRYNMNKPAADELGLPFHMIDSNFHAFTFKMYPNGGAVGKAGYIANYSCILELGRAVKKYYTSNCFSYNQILTVGTQFHNADFAEFSESYSVPLIQTEKTELIIDGCQYTRTQKTEKLADWDIAQKYLNPCSQKSHNTSDAHNCSRCQKCMLALLTFDATGKLEKFSDVFDLETYRKYSEREKAQIVMKHFRHSAVSNEPDIYVFLKAHGMKLPSRFRAHMYFLPSKFKGFTKRAMRKLMGRKLYELAKRIVKH